MTKSVWHAPWTRAASTGEVDQVIQRLTRRIPHVLTLGAGDAVLDEVLADDMDIVELLCAVDQEFNVAITAERLKRMTTVRDLAEAIATPVAPAKCIRWLTSRRR